MGGGGRDRGARLHAGRRDRLRRSACAARASTPRSWRPRARPAPRCASAARVTGLVWRRRARRRRALPRRRRWRARAPRAAGRRCRRAALDVARLGRRGRRRTAQRERPRAATSPTARRPRPTLALDRGAVARGPRARHRVPVRRRPLLVLLMPPVERADDFTGELEGEYRAHRATGSRACRAARGREMVTQGPPRDRHASYFRRSPGPGWALPGDAGHFKDPVTAQGIRDALRFGRLLGEAAAPVLDGTPPRSTRARRLGATPRGRVHRDVSVDEPPRPG